MGKVFEKKYVGTIAVFILVILLSQARFFNVLFDTYLGRLLLVAFILLIAYTNKMLGLVSVLLVIVAFNYNRDNMVYAYNQYEGFTSAGTSETNASKKPTITVKTSSVEGFCMTDRESTILKGKQSNSVPVFNNSREQSDDIDPSDKSVFTSEYASI
jgi:hypothetical protein